MAPPPKPLILRVADAEGWRSVIERLLDRIAAWRERRAFPTVDFSRLPGNNLPEVWRQLWHKAPIRVLDVLATEPRPDLGGVQTQFALRHTEEIRRRPGALLFPTADGFRMELSHLSLGERRRFAVQWTTIRASRSHPEDGGAEMLKTVAEASRLIGAEVIHVEQPHGLPLEPWLAVEKPLVLSLHDFGMFCRRPHLLERPHLEFCDFCVDGDRCTTCLRESWPVGDDFQERRRQLCRRVLRQAAALVYPSEYLRRTMSSLYPDLDPRTGHVVPPPSARPPLARAGSASPKGLRIAYVGSVQAHKGGAAFERLLTQFGTRDCQDLSWHVFGGGDPTILRDLRSCGARIHGYYRSGTLARRLVRAKIDLALVLSVWPESYCLVVDECLHAGVPVLAFDRGAPGERLRRLAGGLLVDPESGIEGVRKAILAIRRDELRLPEVAAKATSELPKPTTAAESMLRIYETVLGSALNSG